MNCYIYVHLSRQLIAFAMIFDQSRNISLLKRVKRLFVSRHGMELYRTVRFLAFIEYVDGLTGKCTAPAISEVLGLAYTGRVSKRLFMLGKAGYVTWSVVKTPNATGRPPRVYKLSEKGVRLLSSFSSLFDEVERGLFQK